MKRVLLIMIFFQASAYACLNQPIEGTDLVSGKVVRLAATEDKPTVAVFLSTVCPCSRSHEPSLRTLAREFPQFAWVGVHANRSESESRGKEYFSKAKLGFPVIRDSESRLANALGAFRTPHAFVIGAGGTCLYRGGVDASHEAQPVETSYLRRALAAVARGDTPDPKETRALGCSIDR